MRLLNHDFPQVGEAENIKTVQFTWWDNSTIQSSPDDLGRCWFPVYLDSWSIFTEPLVQDGSKGDKPSLKKRLRQEVIVFSFDILVVNFICQLDRISGWLSGGVSRKNWLRENSFLKSGWCFLMSAPDIELRNTKLLFLACHLYFFVNIKFLLLQLFNGNWRSMVSEIFLFPLFRKRWGILR